MNSLSLFSPSFADSVIDVLDKNFRGNLGVFAPIKHTSCGIPSVDIRETDTAYIMEADLPGYTEKDVEISLKDRVMTVSSSHKEETNESKKEDGVDYILRERSSRQFTRRFSLPEDINQDEVSAHFENGVLTVNIPKKPDTQPRQIEIKRK